MGSNSPPVEPVDEKTSRSIWVVILWVAAGAILSVFLFGQLGRYFFVAELIGQFRAQFLVLLLPFPILLWRVGSRKFAGLMLLAVGWASIGVLTVYFPTTQPPPGEVKLKVLTFNVYAKNDEVQAVINRIKQIDPDIIAINEYANHWIDELRPLHPDYPFRLTEPRWHGFGMAIFSKYPLDNQRTEQLTRLETDVPTILTDVIVGELRLRICCAHLVSPVNRVRLDLRNRQLKQIAKFVQEDSLPTIVVGDFNGTPWTYFLSKFLFESGLRDPRQGFGYHGSWPTAFWPIAIPIDHAFVSQDIHVHQRVVEQGAGSDHLPVSITISIGSTKPD